MRFREQWQLVPDAELKCRRAKSFSELLTALAEEQSYEIEFEDKTYQVEVQLLENADRYIHVGVAVDDGSMPASFHLLSSSFICHK
ncbi:MAG: hypothetical protein WB729_13455 [Candidatus Sulfotelmatobacter sp.]